MVFGKTRQIQLVFDEITDTELGKNFRGVPFSVATILIHSEGEKLRCIHFSALLNMLDIFLTYDS